MENKTCLVIYIGNGYSEGEPSYYQSYIYSVDMRDNEKNHEENIYPNESTWKKLMRMVKDNK